MWCEMVACEITRIKERNKIVPMVNLTQEAWHDSTVPCLENLSRKLPGDVAMQKKINSDMLAGISTFSARLVPSR